MKGNGYVEFYEISAVIVGLHKGSNAAHYCLRGSFA